MVRLEPRLLSVSAFALTLGLLPAQASAWCQMTTVTGTRLTSERGDCVLTTNHPGTHVLAWQSRCTSISLSSEAPPTTLSMDQVRGVFQRSIATWTSVDCGGAPTGLSVDVLADTNLCSSASHNRGGHNVHSVMFIADGWSTTRRLDPLAYAVTFVWHNADTGEIYDGDMLINNARGPYTICDETSCPLGMVDLENIVTHEMGHYFGVAHTQDLNTDATMFAQAPPGERAKRTLEEDDMMAICSIYPSGSLSAACDNTPRGGLALDCQPHNCGCATPGLPNSSRPLSLASLAGMAAILWGSRKRRARASR